jgi:phosphoribosyl 1,2-cyclic phosphodiesterase
MASTIDISNLDPGKSFKISDINISCIEHAHPGGALGFKFSIDNIKIVFCTDVEHLDDMPQQIIKFAKNADIFAYDAQYTEKEYKTKVGWGHSTHEMAVEIGKKANVKELHLIHHDPQRHDNELQKIEKSFKKEFNNIYVVKEGLEREISISS